MFGDLGFGMRDSIWDLPITVTYLSEEYAHIMKLDEHNVSGNAQHICSKTAV